MRKQILTLFILIFISTALQEINAQISHGGIPYGFKVGILKQSINELSLASPDYNKLRAEDDSLSSLGWPQRVGVGIDFLISPDNQGSWTDINQNVRVWRVNIRVPGATGLGLYFSKFHLAHGDSMFIYSEDRSHFIGAFTEKNNKSNGLFATEDVKGESIIIELVDNKNNFEQSILNISKVMVAYIPMRFVENGPGRYLDPNGISDTCEVNVKCSEGDLWRDQIKGVVRIKTLVGNDSFWCTGSIMNNTALDFKPYILTADHCAKNINSYSSEEEFSQWIFYFNLESVSCSNNTPVGANSSMTGAVKLSGSTHIGLNGSDFLLLLLDESIPNNYDPYFQGWNATNELSLNGVSIHHPEGDVKKISTYTQQLKLSEWGNNADTHFEVYWANTPNGHGVTEPGSSGSPLFNRSRLVIGTLTGGLSECDSPDQSDLFGRVFYSWDKNGQLESQQLKPWLDPLNTGLRILEGSYNDKVAIAQFVADQTVVPIGTYVTFNDLSSNDPDSWDWFFEGGSPSTSNAQDPGQILYDKLGAYDVRLVVSNEFGTDSVLIENYIRVVPRVFPNPTRNNISILFGNEEMEHRVTISNSLGQIIADYMIPATEKQIEYSFTTKPAGIYLIGIQTGNETEYHKVLYTPN